MKPTPTLVLLPIFSQSWHQMQSRQTEQPEKTEHTMQGKLCIPLYLPHNTFLWSRTISSQNKQGTQLSQIHSMAVKSSMHLVLL